MLYRSRPRCPALRSLPHYTAHDLATIENIYDRCTGRYAAHEPYVYTASAIKHCCKATLLRAMKSSGDMPWEARECPEREPEEPEIDKDYVYSSAVHLLKA